MSSYSTMTDNPLVEAVARAMCEARDPDDTTGGPHPQGIWLDDGEAYWTGYINAATAALRAIEDAGWKVVKKEDG